jgi:YD repeat-containing protein
VAKLEWQYDTLGRRYRSLRYAVNPATGVNGNSLKSDFWYDPAGNLMKELEAGSRAFRKTAFDGANRPTRQYLAYDLSETTYAQAGSIADDTVVEQQEISYDAGDNVIALTWRQRFHDATGMGALQGPAGTQPLARIYYQASWPDALGRTIATASYGTNGAAAWTRPALIPARSATVLVGSFSYNDRGELELVTDSLGRKTRRTFDDAGRLTQTVENEQAGIVAPDANRTTLYTYTADSLLATLTAKNSVTGDQVTHFTYGTTMADSALASNNLLRKKTLPDSSGPSDAIFYAYNRRSETISATDQAGTTHAFDYDLLGRLEHDRVTALASGLDGSVRRISRAYEVRGRRQ